ncbi:MAG: HU family DNA-binding protein [Acidobacteria bacterium]|nr:HU family DNA-binding protein [Acidobacteriota bacterium]
MRKSNSVASAGFRLRHRGAHSARNPGIGDSVDVPSKRVAYFKAGRAVKERINREPAPAASEA